MISSTRFKLQKTPQFGLVSRKKPSEGTPFAEFTAPKWNSPFLWWLKHRDTYYVWNGPSDTDCNKFTKEYKTLLDDVQSGSRHRDIFADNLRAFRAFRIHWASKAPENASKNWLLKWLFGLPG